MGAIICKDLTVGSALPFPLPVTLDWRSVGLGLSLWWGREYAWGHPSGSVSSLG